MLIFLLLFIFYKVITSKIIFDDLKLDIADTIFDIKFVNIVNTTTIPTIMPTLEPTIETFIQIPTIYPTIYPTIIPSYINSNKILKFSVNIQLYNFTKSELDNNDKNIILTAFEDITDISKEYLTFQNKNIRYRLLTINILNILYYTLNENILLSIPLTNTYESRPLELYDSIRLSFTDSINSGLFEELVKEYALIYNYSSFYNINFNLGEITDPEIITLNKKKHNSSINIRKYIALLVVSGFLFFVLIYNLYKYQFKLKLFNSRIESSNSQAEEFSILNNDINESENYNLVKDLCLVEESRIVEKTVEMKL